MMFPLSSIGRGRECGRTDCTTCTQEKRGEVLPQCNKRSVLYENICTKCNQGVEDKSKKLSPPTNHPSIYVGETARSLYERGKEHWRGYMTQAEDSHIYKHHQLHHGGEGEPSFHLRPVRFFRTALSRQLAEAVRIQRWGEEVILNSRSEYNRCKIGRLTRVVSQAQFQIGAAPQKAENRSKIGATSRGVPLKAENRSKIGATVRGGL